ncbi:MAG: hypothetical protein ACYTG5_00595 [Planctomycetota bacterium]
MSITPWTLDGFGGVAQSMQLAQGPGMGLRTVYGTWQAFAGPARISQF